MDDDDVSEADGLDTDVFGNDVLDNDEPDDDAADGEAAGVPGSDPTPHTSEAWPAQPRPVVPARGPAQLDLDFELRELVAGLDSADAFEVDARLRRALGFTTREAWVRERLGMDPTRARALVRLERACAESPPLARAWRTGALSWVKAAALVPLASANPLGRFVPDWVSWAGRVTVRRLRDDAERALTLAETDPESFRRAGGLPVEARHRASATATPGAACADRGIGAIQKESEGESGRERPDGSNGSAALGESGRGIRAIEKDPEGEPHRLAGDGGDGGERAECTERETGADRTGPEADSRRPGRDLRLVSHVGGLAARAHAGLNGKPGPDETRWVRLFGSLATVRLFRTALCAVRRRLEIDTRPGSPRPARPWVPC